MQYSDEYIDGKIAEYYKRKARKEFESDQKEKRLQEKVIDLYSRGATIESLLKMYSISLKYAYEILSSREGLLREEDREQVNAISLDFGVLKEEYDNGAPISQIARSRRVSKSLVYKILREGGTVFRRRGAKETRKVRELSEALPQLRSQGLTMEVIAKEFGVSVSSVHKKIHDLGLGGS